jgi:cellulose synthase/poly-beta-1,6-N-acetylglucosamine synthase-like glycosyltransferase
MGQAFPFIIPPITFTIDGGTIIYHSIGNISHSIRNKLKSKEKETNKKDSLETIVSAPKKDVTIIISSHGDEKTIENNIRPVFEQTYAIKNIYISDSNIDNTKQVVDKLSKEFPNLHYWSREGITSKSEKINCLVKDSNVELGDYIYLKDASAKLAPNVLEKLVSGFTEDNIAAVTSFGFVTPPNNTLAKYFHFGKEWTNRLGKFRKTAQEYRRAMFVVCGASFMTRSDILKNINIPIGTQTEDTAYTWKLQEEGYKIGVVQDAIVNAEDVTSLKSQLKQSYRWYTGTWQNLYTNFKELFGPKSKAKALGYSTILPGLVESLAYTGTIASLPILCYTNPNIAKAFVIGDTTLSLISPFISTLFAGEPEKGPKIGRAHV